MHPCLPIQVGCSVGTRGTGGTLRRRGSGELIRWDTGDGWGTYLYLMLRTPAHYLLCVPAPAVLPFVTILCHLCAHKEKKSRKRLIATQRGKSCLSLQKML